MSEVKKRTQFGLVNGKGMSLTRRDRVKLYLDDLRHPPDGFAIARNYDECILMLEQCDVSTLSLDHDLGESKSGYDVAKWIVEHGRWPSSIYLHTSNPVGRDNMYQLLMHYKPEHVSVYPFRPV